MQGLRVYQPIEFTKERSKIGEGGNGTIYIYTTLQLNKLVVKEAKSQGQQDKEIEILKSLSHENIIEMLGLFRDDEHKRSGIVFEYYSEGTLETVIMGNWNTNRDENTHLIYDQRHIILWMKQITDALQYLHEKTIVHNDVKPANIFMSENYLMIKLADFGSARHQGSDSKSFLVTPNYRTPLHGDLPHVKHDIYSVGIVLWQLVYRRKPFDGIQTDDILNHANIGNRPPLDGCNEILKKIIERSWSKKLDDSWTSPALHREFLFWDQKMSQFPMSSPSSYTGPQILIVTDMGVLHELYTSSIHSVFNPRTSAWEPANYQPDVSRHVLNSDQETEPNQSQRQSDDDDWEWGERDSNFHAKIRDSIKEYFKAREDDDLDEPTSEEIL